MKIEVDKDVISKLGKQDFIDFVVKYADYDMLVRIDDFLKNSIDSITSIMSALDKNDRYQYAEWNRLREQRRKLRYVAKNVLKKD